MFLLWLENNVERNRKHPCNPLNGIMIDRIPLLRGVGECGNEVKIKVETEVKIS